MFTIIYSALLYYSQLEETAKNSSRMASSKWEAKHRSGTLPELVAGQRVCVNAPSDVGREGVIVRKDNNPCSWWVQLGDSVVKRNRKHLFVLDQQNEEPRSSSASLRFGESTSYNPINPVRVLLNSSRLLIPVLNWIMQPALLVTSTLVTAMKFHLLTLRGVMEMVRSRAWLRVRFSRGSQTTLRQGSPDWKRWRLHLLSWKTRLIEKNQLR